MKKLRFVFVMLFALLTGCGFTAGIDTLISPPKLTLQQEHIYNALKAYTGTNINLKYPKSGDYLSAFIVDDIDGDSDDEAIVFYEKISAPADNSSLRINVLDCVNDKWQSTFDRVADGNEVEKIIITRLGDNSRINIIVGYSLINQSEKVVSIYHYEDGKLNTTFENNYYSLFDTADMNGDNTKELFMAINQSPSRDSSAEIYHLNENGEYQKSSIVLEEEAYIDYAKISYGKLYDGSTGIYLDSIIGNGALVTNIFSVDENNMLTRAFTPDSQKQETLRPVSYTCGDADGDGKIEIPMPELFPGYEPEDESPLYLTKWYELEEKGLSEKMCGYISITNGYSFIFPDGWLNNVTAYSNIEKNRITFCQSTGQEPEFEKGLVTVQTIPENDEKKMNELIETGYEILHSRGDKLFMININKNDKMTDPPAELMFRFKFYD